MRNTIEIQWSVVLAIAAAVCLGVLAADIVRVLARSFAAYLRELNSNVDPAEKAAARAAEEDRVLEGYRRLKAQEAEQSI